MKIWNSNESHMWRHWKTGKLTGSVWTPYFPRSPRFEFLNHSRLLKLKPEQSDNLIPKIRDVYVKWKKLTIGLLLWIKHGALHKFFAFLERFSEQCSYFLLFLVLFGFYYYCSLGFAPIFRLTTRLRPRFPARFSSRNSSRARIFTSQFVVTTRFHPPCWNSHETRTAATRHIAPYFVLFPGTASAAWAHQRLQQHCQIVEDLSEKMGEEQRWYL